MDGNIIFADFCKTPYREFSTYNEFSPCREFLTLQEPPHTHTLTATQNIFI